MADLNLLAAWGGILLGLLSGIPMGMLFHRENWLGGYDSWERRLLRLGHISFFGIAFLNITFSYTVERMHWTPAQALLPSILLIVAQIAMPTVCILAAFRKEFRNLFFIPVASVFAGSSIVVWRLLSTLSGVSLIVYSLMHGVTR